MKKYGLIFRFCFTVFLCVFTSCSKDSDEIENPGDVPNISEIEKIEVLEPGTIESVLGEKRLVATVNLKVSGKLNSDDLNTLSRMGATEALKFLDLSDTYMYDENGNVTDYFTGVRLVETLIISKHVSVIDGLGGNIADNRKEVKKVVIPDNVTKIADNCFRINENIDTLVLPKNLLYIGENAFQGCTNLKKIEFPESVEYIGKMAFVRSGIEYIEIGNKVKHIEKGLFNECPNFKEMHINMKSVPVLFEDYYYNVETITLGKDVEYIQENALLYLNKLKFVYCLTTEVPALIGYTPISEPFLSLRSKGVILYVPKGNFVKYWENEKFSGSFVTIQEMK